MLIERLKRENPHRTGTTLLRELALSAGQDTAGISASTLYRFLKQRGLSERQRLAPPAHKKFEAEHSNQIWQSDMLFGPYVQRPGGGKMQAMLHAILDDASRLIPHAQFYTSQGLDACPDCLRQAVAARAAAIRLYMDNAKICRSPQLARIAASIGMLIVHTPPYQPEGRGKIERFFRSCREQSLNNLDRKQTLSMEELNERLWVWIDLYHRTGHSSLGTTPLLRWQRDIEHIRQLPPATDFRRLFFHRLDRVVRRDCTFLLQNRFYEAPPQLPGGHGTLAGAASGTAVARAATVPGGTGPVADAGHPVCRRGAEGRQIPAGGESRAFAGGRRGPAGVSGSHPTARAGLPVRVADPAICRPSGHHARVMGSAADQNLFVDTRATGHLLSAPQGLQHFLTAAQVAAAEIIILDPLYSTHDQDENDTRAMAALCQSLLRLREASRAALVVVHHVAATRLAAPSAAPAPCMRWATATSC